MILLNGVTIGKRIPRSQDTRRSHGSGHFRRGLDQCSAERTRGLPGDVLKSRAPCGVGNNSNRRARRIRPWSEARAVRCRIETRTGVRRAPVTAPQSDRRRGATRLSFTKAVRVPARGRRGSAWKTPWGRREQRRACQDSLFQGRARPGAGCPRCSLRCGRGGICPGCPQRRGLVGRYVDRHNNPAGTPGAEPDTAGTRDCVRGTGRPTPYPVAGVHIRGLPGRTCDPQRRYRPPARRG